MVCLGRGSRIWWAGASSESLLKSRWFAANPTAANLLQVMHQLANPPQLGEEGGSEGMDAEVPVGKEDAVPLDREVVAQVVDALFDR